LRAARESAFGTRIAVAEAQIIDRQGKLIASGLGTYITAPPKNNMGGETHGG